MANGGCEEQWGVRIEGAAAAHLAQALQRVHLLLQLLLRPPARAAATAAAP